MPAGEKHLLRKQFLMNREESDLSIRQRVLMNERSMEDIRKFVDCKNPEDHGYKDILSQMTSRARENLDQGESLRQKIHDELKLKREKLKQNSLQASSTTQSKHGK